VKPENLEFIALFEASGWRQAEAARELKTTRATLSRCLSGDQVPSAPLIKLFELILANRQPGALTRNAAAREAALADWEKRIIDDLRYLREDDRERVLKAMRAILEALPKREAEVPRPPGQPSREEVKLYTSTAARASTLAEKSGSKGSKRRDEVRERAGRVPSREED
jgi:transcriptional regulator with XRE-family HTH domain